MRGPYIFEIFFTSNKGVKLRPPVMECLVQSGAP